MWYGSGSDLREHQPSKYQPCFPNDVQGVEMSVGWEGGTPLLPMVACPLPAQLFVVELMFEKGGLEHSKGELGKRSGVIVN